MALAVATILSDGLLPFAALLVASMQAPEVVAVAAASWWEVPAVSGPTGAVGPSGSDPHNRLSGVPSVSFSLSRYSDFTWLAMVSYESIGGAKGWNHAMRQGLQPNSGRVPV